MSELAKNAPALVDKAVALKEDKERRELYRKTVFKEGSDAEFELFMHLVSKTGLDPLARQIYAVKLQGKVAPIVSIDGLRLTAERSGKYAGQVGPQWCGKDGIWKDVWLSSESPAAARVGILRKDFAQPCWGVARYASYSRPSPTWSSMGDVMIAKCAEALGLRKAFPMELSGLYTQEEMEQAGIQDLSHLQESPQTIEAPTALVGEGQKPTPSEPVRTYNKDNQDHKRKLAAALKKNGWQPADMAQANELMHGKRLDEFDELIDEWCTNGLPVGVRNS